VLPYDMAPQGEMIVKVHAVVAEGHVLVVDYKGTIIPVVVGPEQAAHTQDLFRGDKIKIAYKFREEPGHPTHVEVDNSAAKPVEVLASILPQHGQTMTFEGNLVLFPNSPQVAFNVFALQVDIGDDVKLEYTLLNFEDPDLFQKIREKLQGIWDASAIVAENSRNKLIKKGLRIRATGPINVVTPNQANPQIILNSLEDLELL
ncbi:MAG: hypothetical protein KDD22_04350, partial [Bdellovibrionales bacterium]|nr:hypothetical protein [Bdellovibrionales bacterium]